MDEFVPSYREATRDGFPASEKEYQGNSWLFFSSLSELFFLVISFLKNEFSITHNIFPPFF